MNQQFDAVARQLGHDASRRRIVQGLGALAIGSLGIGGLTRTAEAKKCRKRCKDHCRNQRSGKKNRNDCRNRCRNRCG